MADKEKKKGFFESLLPTGLAGKAEKSTSDYNRRQKEAIDAIDQADIPNQVGKKIPNQVGASIRNRHYG